MSEQPRVALVAREVAPLGGGGIGVFVSATAETLAAVAEVTIFTSSMHQRAARRLRRSGGGLPAVEIVFVAEPRAPELGHYYNALHLWSARVLEAIFEHYGERGPDLIEFPDYLGEACVTVQAARTSDPRLAETAVCVRLNTTAEMCLVLDGFLSPKFEERSTFELERYALANCDHVLWAGGDVLGTFGRFYGENGLASPLQVRQPFGGDPGPLGASYSPEEPLKLLYVGRLERRKGVRQLIDAAVVLPGEDWSLTLVGGDTKTAPLGQPMRSWLELEVAGDPRISFRDSVSREEVGRLISEHDVVVLPSLWECWPNAALEALARNRPVIATPTGGFLEMVRPGVSGWLTEEVSTLSLRETMEAVLSSRGQVAQMQASGGPRSVFDELTDRDAIRAAYLDICRREKQGGEARAARSALVPVVLPLVSIVIPYFHLHEFIEEAVASAVGQDYPRIEVILVNDGSFRAEDRLLQRLAEEYGITLLTQENSGLGAARNFGIGQSRGRYVFPLDADNVAHPTFVSRCVEALERDRRIAYVTSWSRYVDETGQPWEGRDVGYRPLGNSVRMLAERNMAGDAAALLRRRLFDLGFWYSEDLTSYEDWSYYRELRQAGLIGHVIPETLVDYRIRETSMVRSYGEPHAERIHGEIEARLREQEIEWTR